jgi:hypothetical protein
LGGNTVFRAKLATRFGIFHRDVEYLEIGARENMLALLDLRRGCLYNCIMDH